MVGSSRTGHARLASPAQFAIIDAPGAGTNAGQGTIVVAVNSSSLASGYYLDGSGYSHGFLRAPDGTFTTFDAEGPRSRTQVWWMNDQGWVVGELEMAEIVGARHRVILERAGQQLARPLVIEQILRQGLTGALNDTAMDLSLA